MRVKRDNVTREEVIRFYATYDRRKKGQPPLSDIAEWPWDDPNGIDCKLADNGLKAGVLAAYRTWSLVEFNIADLLECAIVKDVFPGQPRTLCQLVLLGKLAEWFPIAAPEWWRLIGNGSELDVESALIVRPALKSEAPAKWYLEDGTGRAIALVQRILRYGEAGRTVWAYLGNEPDEQSAFIRSRRELKAQKPSYDVPNAEPEGSK
jgi:hypothetical protein